jgi:hypothetical protein
LHGIEIVGLSIGVSLAATALASALSLPFGTALAIFPFRGRRLIVVLINALFGLPPVVVGLILYLALSHSGPLGFRKSGRSSWSAATFAVSPEPLRRPLCSKPARAIYRYDVIELSPKRHLESKLDAGKIFADWLVSAEGQQAIGAFQVNGQKLFNPSAASPK